MTSEGHVHQAPRLPPWCPAIMDPWAVATTLRLWGNFQIFWNFFPQNLVFMAFFPHFDYFKLAKSAEIWAFSKNVDPFWIFWHFFSRNLVFLRVFFAISSPFKWPLLAVLSTFWEGLPDFRYFAPNWEFKPGRSNTRLPSLLDHFGLYSTTI